MSTWEKSVITQRGYALLAKLHSGTTLTLTRAVAGAGSVTSEELKTLESVPDERQALSFTTTSYPEEQQCAVPVRLYNKGLSDGYTAQVIGIYAADPDEGEILYMATRSADGGANVPAESEMPYTASWVFYVKFGAADGVTITADASAGMSYDDVVALMNTYDLKVQLQISQNAQAVPVLITEHNDDEDAHPKILASMEQVAEWLGEHMNSESNPHKVTAEQVGITYGTEDLVAGESELETGKMYFVYE